MEPTTPAQTPEPSVSDTQKLHPMIVLQPGEKVLATIKRHPFGIVSMYIAAVFGIAAAAAVLLYFVPNVLGQYTSFNPNTVLYSALGIVVVVLVAVLGVATSVYWQNQWVVTSDSVTQILQNSLFSRQVSQMSMENLEDVTVDKSGILPQLFNYGTLQIETAGERSKFRLKYCPRPNYYARLILEAHEAFREASNHLQN